MKIIIMILTLLFITNIAFAEDNTTNSINSFNDISWSEVTRVEKVKKIIARITILRMMGVVSASFWSEFGLDLDKDTIDWEKMDGIDIDMVLSAHESMTQEIEAKLNKNGSTLGGEEFLRATIIAASLKILDYHVEDGKILDEGFEPILDKDLSKKIKDRIKILAGDKINPEDGVNGERQPSNSNSTHQFTDKFKSRLSDLFSDFDSDDPAASLADQLGAFGSNTNWEDNAGIGHDSLNMYEFYLGAELISFLLGASAHQGGDVFTHFEDGWDATILGRVINNGLDWGDTRLEKEEGERQQEKDSQDFLNGMGNDGADCGNNDNDTDHGVKKDDETGTDSDCDRNPDDGSVDGQTYGVPTSDDINNINNNNDSHGGTTYIEGSGAITDIELSSAMKRIDTIKNQYGTPCNELTGQGCNGDAGEYKDDPLKTGEAVTNPGKLEK